MAEDGRVVFRITADSSQATQALNDFEETAQNTADSTKKSFSDSAKEIAASIGAAFSVKKILEFGKAAVDVASDLGEVQNVVDTTFGEEGAQKINEWAMSAAEAFGESELQAKQFTATIGAMFKSMGLGQKEIEEMSIGIAGLAGDMASFYNLDPTEAFEKLRAGISGETEPLKQLGINMSVVNLEAYAMTQGITTAYEEMTQAEQATLRYQYIMQATADAQGDFSKTSDSFANQTRILKLEMETLAAEIGQDLLPIALELTSWAREAIQWGTEHKEVLEVLASAIIGATTAWAAYKTTIAAEALYDMVTDKTGAIATAAKGAKSAIGGLSSAFSAMPPEAKIAAASIALITAAVIALQEAQEEALNKQLEYMDSLTTLADYQANGLVNPFTGEVDYAEAERMKKEGTFKEAETTLGAAPGRTFWVNKGGKLYAVAGEGATNSAGTSRHQTGEDFVMADWTPAFLDYGERVLTRQENLAYTAMGGVDGMARMASAPASTQQQKVDVGVGFKVEPREAAHFLTPYIIDEMNRTGKG